MESPKSTKLLNEIFAKLSLLTKEDEEAQGIVAEEQEVVGAEALETVELQEEVTEPTVEQEEAVEASAEETTEEKVEMAEEEEVLADEEQVEESEELEEGYVSMEKYNEDMAKVMAMMEELKKRVDDEMGGYKKEKEAMAEQIEKLSAEPAAQPINHTPDADAPEKTVFSYSGNRPQSTIDRVMNRIGNK